MIHQDPFVFRTERRLVSLTGRKARNLPELLAHLREVPGSSVFYHTHHQYVAHHFEKPLFHNDFSIWTSSALLEEPLAEKLAAIDLLEFSSVRQLRAAIVRNVDSYVAEIGGRVRDCMPGDEFHFCESKSFVMPTGIVAYDVTDFFSKLSRLTNTSLYFHFFESRLRLGNRTNDFSRWLFDRGAEDLARAIGELNPYVMTLEELKDAIVRLGKAEG